MILEYFKQISAIPRSSYQEQAISDFCVEFAKQHGLRYVQDPLGNVIIYKKASEGYETHKTTMLQAHLDMVAAKTTESVHDFLNDTIELVERDGWLYANDTTLGADDGVGVAYMLAILSDTSLQHPALECVFTVQEEIGLLGALALDTSVLSAEYCIGLDCAGEHCTTVSCTGGIMGTVQKSYILNTIFDTQLSIKVSGLQGGHSGIEIASERGNAIKIAFHLLYELTKVASLGIASIHGGEKNNAIPRESSLTIGINSVDIPLVEETIAKVVGGFKVMYDSSDPDFAIHTKFQLITTQSISADATVQMIDFMYLMPDGYFHKSPLIKDLVLSSTNVGVIAMDGVTFSLDFYIRSPQPFMLQQVQHSVNILCKNFGFQVVYYNQYPGWNYDVKSNLRELLMEVHQEIYNSEMLLDSTHGGMELGVWKEKIANIDIVTLGPIMEEIHSPKERLNIASFIRTYHFLITVLQRI